jgi:hypothetical protein
MILIQQDKKEEKEFSKALMRHDKLAQEEKKF